MPARSRERALLLRHIAGAVIAALASSCSIDANFGGTGFQCTAEEPCPPGFTCESGSCVAGAVDASRIDAPPMPDADPFAPDAAVDSGPPDSMRPDAFGCQDPIAVIDDFEDGTAAPLWSVVTDPQTSITETGGLLVATMSTNNAGRFASYFSTSSYDLSNSRVFIEVPQIPSNSAISEVRFGPTGTNSVFFRTENGMLRFDGRINNTPISQSIIVSYDATNHRWWQFRDQGGTLYADTSPDGQNWTVLASLPTPAFVTSGDIQITVGTPTVENNPGEAHFDNLNGGGAVTPCP